MKLVIMISLLLFVTAHFPFSVSIPPLLPSPSRLHFPHLLTCLFLLFLSPSLLLLLLLLLFSMTPPSSLISHLSQVASCLVTFSSSTWLCWQENQTLSEPPQGKPNADRAWTLALLFVVEGWGWGGGPSGKSNAPRARGSAGTPLHPAGTYCLLLTHFGNMGNIKVHMKQFPQYLKYSQEY